MNKFLSIFIIFGLLISVGDGGRPRKAAKKGKSGNSNSRNPKAPSGPRDPTEGRETRGIKRKIFENIENVRDRAKPAKRARVETAAVEVDYDSAKLHNIFITLNAVYEEIIAHEGGNSFKQPHTIKDHL
jgi:hypothetical protein